MGTKKYLKKLDGQIIKFSFDDGKYYVKCNGYYFDFPDKDRWMYCEVIPEWCTINQKIIEPNIRDIGWRPDQIRQSNYIFLYHKEAQEILRLLNEKIFQ